MPHGTAVLRHHCSGDRWDVSTKICVKAATLGKGIRGNFFEAFLHTAKYARLLHKTPAREH